MNRDILKALDCIDPAALDYQDWLNVGMALKLEGYPVHIWEDWSRADTARFHEGECTRKWAGFNGNATPVTAGTVFMLAKQHGWKPAAKDVHELAWDAEITQDYKIIQTEWLEGRELVEPSTWDPAQQLITYLETLFEADEHVGYVSESYHAKNGRYLPSMGFWDRTAGQLIESLRRSPDDITDTIGTYNTEAGAWIRFNPLDGQGCKNANVTDYRYTLVESDSTDIEKQNEILRQLEIPVACLVYSGKKSLHAIVRIDAINYDEYRKRVDFLYSVCEKNGLSVDRQNKNPSRLSRLPGAIRDGHKQYLVDTNIGKRSWAEWREWIEAVNDDLPDPESLADTWDDMPPLSAPLINGILRQGHKMLLAGASKAGKSFALIQLCIAIAEGKQWLGFDCAQGRVLYVNLELDRASCLHRFKEVYEATKTAPKSIKSIDIWNLRGKSVPMDKLAPKLIRRAQKKNYIAVVIDPIYKVITGDENSADQMAHFCNQFDKVCTELDCAVIYCHHHSKGTQAGKRSMDRASGSGVFARDPDALIDMTELDTENIDTGGRTAWRIEGTLREFAPFEPINIWFDYPRHYPDAEGKLTGKKVLESVPTAMQLSRKGNDAKQDRKQRRLDSLQTAFDLYSQVGKGSKATVNGWAKLEDVAEYLQVSVKTVQSYIKEQARDGGIFRYKNGEMYVVDECKQE
ncbi:AAA family ATPase [Negativicoccus succinicivorans]|nr:AAA family ATPase [Negativicoccus succinicivorans]